MSRLSRRLAVAGIAAAGLAALPGVAAAASNVSAPANDSTIYLSQMPSSPSSAVTFAGTAPPSSTIDLICGVAGQRKRIITTGVAVPPSGYFSVTLSGNAFTTPPSGFGGWCQLAAVPTGAITYDASETGPQVFIAQNLLYTGTPGLYDYYLWVPVTQRVAFDLMSFGGCGLDDSYDFTPLADTAAVNFWCNGYVRPNGVAGATVPAPGLSVDGRNATDVRTARDLSGAAYAPLSYGVQFDPRGRRTTVTETDPIQLCATNTLPVNTASCAPLSGSAVRMTRRMTVGVLPGRGWSDSTGQVVMRDTWSASDGRRHVVAMQAEEDFNTPTYGFSVGWRGLLSAPLPTVTSFLGGAVPATLPVPSTTGPVTYRQVRVPGSPVAPGNSVAMGTFYPAPATFTWGSSATRFDAGQTFVIPAGKTVVLTRIYAVAGTVAEAQRVERVVRDEAVIPKLAVHRTSPAVTSRMTGRLSGLMMDPAGVDTVTVNGHRVRVNARGRFTATVRLRHGRNTIVVKVADSGGNVVSVRLRITRR